jgi:hypothetical protein
MPDVKMARLLELRQIPEERDPQQFIYLLFVLHQDSVLLHFLFYLHTFFSVGRVAQSV